MASRLLAFDPDEVLRLVREIEEDREPLEDVSAKLSGIVRGMSGHKFRTLMAKLVSLMPNDLAYLELGIFQALTPLVVAASNPNKTVIGVDNFSQFDVDNTNIGKINNAMQMLGLSNLDIRTEDFEQFLMEMRGTLAGKVGIFYFDACHDYRSQTLALQYATQYVAPGGVIVVDDCNYPHIRQASADLLTVFPEFKLAFEAYTETHPKTKTPEEAATATHTWWNGVNVIIHDPQNRLDRLIPPVPSQLREQFVKQHGFAGCCSNGAPTRVAQPGRQTPWSWRDAPAHAAKLAQDAAFFMRRRLRD